MKSLKQIKEELKEGVVMGLHQTQRDIAIIAAYSDMSPGERKSLDSWCMKKYGRRFMDCTSDEQSAARSIIHADPKQVEKQNKRDALREEEDPLADLDGEDEGGNEEEDKKEELPTPEEKEEEEEKKFINILQDQDFVSAFSNEVKKYVSKHLLNDDYNSFAVLPFISFLFKDSQYGISVDFESALTFNIDEKGNVYEKDISPKISSVKYTTPEFDELVDLEDEIGITFIDTIIRDALEDIKKVSR